MWLFLWVVFVLAAIGFFLWSYHATYEQKRVWRKYAERFNLQYFGGQMMDTPSMAGEIKGHRVNFYPQITENPQGQKVKQNVVEVFLNDVPDLVCIVATSGFSDFMAEVGLPEPFHMDHENWPTNMLSRTFEEETPEIWFNEHSDRIVAIQNMKKKLPFDFAFVTDTEQAFIAVRTTNPLDNDKKLNKLMTVMFDAVKKLEAKAAPKEENKEKETEDE